MIKRYSSIGLSILLLVSITIGAALWVRVFYSSMRTYRSPLREAELVAQPSTLPQTNKVVIVLISGLGYDAAQLLELPVFEQLNQIGATAAMESTPPTYSQTSWATLITGAPPDTNDAPPFDRSLEDLYPLEIDTIFARTHDAGLQTALLGTAAWGRLVPRNQLDRTFYVEQPGPQSDQAIVEAALPLLDDERLDLVLIQLTQLDFAGQRLGGSSGPADRQAAQAVDTHLGQISAAMDLSQSVLIVLADHGHLDNGGHGGDEVEIIWQPLIMIGDGIVPGIYSDMHQTDIAPTLSTLLGLAPPTAAQGRILFEMLELTERDQTIAQILLARQRTALAEQYITQIQGPEAVPPEALSVDLARAQSAFTTNNISGALQLGLLVQSDADTQLAATRLSRTRSEQWPRLLIALLVVTVWFATMWRRRGFHASSIIVATAATIGLYHGLFQLQGYNYSLSSVNDFSELPFDIIRRAAVSMLVGGGLILIFLMLTGEEDWLTLLGTGYGFGVLVTFVFALPLGWAFWQNGWMVTWRLPGVSATYWQITSLFELIISAGLGLILPWPIMAFNVLVNLIRRRLNQSRSQTEADAMPGLHL